MSSAKQESGKIETYINTMDNDKFMALARVMRSEAWGQILSGSDDRTSINQVRNDAVRFAPAEMLTTNKSVAQFVAAASQRLLDPRNRS